MCEKSTEILNPLSPEHESMLIVYKATPELNDQYWCPSTYGHKADISYNLNENLIPILDSVKFIILYLFNIFIFTMLINFRTIKK